MEARYIRNIGALTDAEQLILREKCVLVAGCGGLGGYLIEMMARLGIGEIRAADGDCFDCSNLNRQLYAETDRIGESKVLAAQRRVESIAPETRFTACEAFLTAENTPALLTGCDAVLDGLDSAAARQMLKEVCNIAGVPYVFGAVGGWTAQAALLLPGMKLPVTTETPERSTLAPIPALCAAVQVSLCLHSLLGRRVEAGRLYCFDLDNMDSLSFELSRS